MTYYDWQITHSEVMFVGIMTSQYHDTPEGLKSQLSIRICRITAKLSHSIELELKELHQIRMDSCKACALERLR
jgi:hypothetical protein